MSNLEWVTTSENALHGYVFGKHLPAIVPRGRDHHNAKLTDGKVRRILKMAAKSVSHAEIGAKFGVAQTTISQICRGESWRHVPRD